MGLLDKIWKKERNTDLFEFNRNTLLKEIDKVARRFNELKGSEGQQDIIAYIEMSMNLGIIALAEQKELTSEAYAYRRGQIDALRNVLIARETAIANSQKEKETKGQGKPSDNSQKRSYLKRDRRAVGNVGILD